MIILDPPAFTKTRQALSGALRGYKEINLRAMKMLPKGGYLVTCSCSTPQAMAYCSTLCLTRRSSRRIEYQLTSQMP